MNIDKRALVGAIVLFATVVCSAPAGAGGTYSVTLSTTAEPATFVITSSESPTMRVTEALKKDEKKTIAIDAGPGFYEFVITRCGQTLKNRWNRGGIGVAVVADGCGSLSFTMKR